MTTSSKTNSGRNGSWLVIEGVPGLTIAPANTPLTRLNYYDGKRLDASGMQLEQDALRRLVHLSNQAGGFGVVHGFDTNLAGGDLLAVGPGQAIDAEGRLLLLPQDVEVSITELITRSLAQPVSKQGAPADPAAFGDCELIVGQPPGLVSQQACPWLITIAHAEFACGEEDVYGKLCEQACVSSIERAFRVEGVVLRARQLVLGMPLPSSNMVALTATHLRSQVASAYYAEEQTRPASMISGAGLRSNVWCRGAELAAGEVALGVLCRQGMSNLWFDAWTARRERMQSPPRAYWAHHMAMRTWPEFLAQVLQFQCQLAGLLASVTSKDGQLIAPVANDMSTLMNARGVVDTLLESWSGVMLADELRALTVDSLANLRELLELGGGPGQQTSGKQILIDGGIVELPPAGYLPVDPTSSMSINEQVRRMLGEGVDLRFCVVRPDDVARELEGAQHMERISLLRGLDEPGAKPPVDILVPDGELVTRTHAAEGLSFRAKLGFGVVRDNRSPSWRGLLRELDELDNLSSFRGAARATPNPDGGGSVHIASLMYLVAGDARLSVGVDLERLVPLGETPGTAAPIKELVAALAHSSDPDDVPLDTLNFRMVATGVWLDMSCGADPFEIPLDSALNVSFLLRVGSGRRLIEYRINGELRITDRDTQQPGRRTAIGRLRGTESQTGLDPDVGSAINSRFEVEITDLRPSGAGLIVSVRPFDGMAMLRNDVIVAWDHESFALSGLWVFRSPTSDFRPQLVFSALEPDPGVLAETDPDHVAAVNAVSSIAIAMNDPDFVQEALAKLFPPSPTSEGTLEVKAVHDWVLFHARHRKQCEFEPAELPRPKLPRYRVFTRMVDSIDERAILIDQLRTDSENLSRDSFTEVGSVEYQPDVATLVTSPAVIEALWTPHATDLSLAWGGIASYAIRSYQLERARLLAVEEIVERRSPAVDQQESVLLPKVPRVFEGGEADGVIVLLTMPRSEARPLGFSLYLTADNAADMLLSVNVPERGDVMLSRDGSFDAIVEQTRSIHVADVTVLGNQVTTSSVGETRTLQGLSQVITFTRRDNPSPPETGRVEAATVQALGELGINIARAFTFTHLKVDFGWPSERGDVIVFACGKLVRPVPGGPPRPVGPGPRPIVDG